MTAVGGKPPPWLVWSTRFESSSSPKLGFVFSRLPNGGSAITLKSRGSLRIKALDGSRRVAVNGKAEDLNDKSTNRHASNSGIFETLHFWFLLSIRFYQPVVWFPRMRKYFGIKKMWFFFFFSIPPDLFELLRYGNAPRQLICVQLLRPLISFFQ